LPVHSTGGCEGRSNLLMDECWFVDNGGIGGKAGPKYWAHHVNGHAGHVDRKEINTGPVDASS